MSYEAKLKEMGIVLPAVPKPVAAYVPAAVTGSYVYTAGQVPFVEGKIQFAGAVGKDLTLDEGAAAARICALNCLAAIREAVGSLDRIRRIVKLTAFVQSGPGFFDQPKVVNGASELIGQIFGEAGKHAREAVGVSNLPLNSAVEISVIAEIG
ncbi:MAG: RidA family protein [Firmicutes bacterium]|nr:RidA family protein [Bacillota bacterium]